MTKIAIIEDAQAISQMYRIKFEDAGYEVETAENGKTGLALVLKSQPDVILLDIMLPELNGNEVLEELRKTSWGKKVKVIVVTNLDKAQIPKSLSKLNVDRYVVKAHTTPALLLKTVKEIL